MNAVISPDGLYRYWLSRPGTRPDDPLVICMLNPSQADAEVDDPTIKRLYGFAGGRAFVVVNLSALRATDPRELLTAADPVGPDNDHYLESVMEGGLIVCAWGTNASKERVEAFLGVATGAGCGLLCFGTNKDHSPRHPLYLKSGTPLQRWDFEAWRAAS